VRSEPRRRRAAQQRRRLAGGSLRIVPLGLGVRAGAGRARAGGGGPGGGGGGARARAGGPGPGHQPIAGAAGRADRPGRARGAGGRPRDRRQRAPRARADEGAAGACARRGAYLLFTPAARGACRPAMWEGCVADLCGKVPPVSEAVLHSCAAQPRPSCPAHSLSCACSVVFQICSSDQPPSVARRRPTRSRTAGCRRRGAGTAAPWMAASRRMPSSYHEARQPPAQGSVTLLRTSAALGIACSAPWCALSFVAQWCSITNELIRTL